MRRRYAAGGNGEALRPCSVRIENDRIAFRFRFAAAADYRNPLGFPFGEAVAKRLMRSLRRSAKWKRQTIGRLTKDLIHRKRSPFPKGEGKKRTSFQIE